MDQLVERVWADRLPQRARNTLYGYVSRLRQALAVADGAEVVRRSGGYVLNVEATAVDLHRFHDLAAGARAAARNEQDEQAAVLFGQALRLWRGDAFAGLDTPWVNALRDTVDKERIAAELDHTDVRLRRCHHTGLLPELSARVETDPLDERLVGQLILALYRSGRPAEALSHYERTRLLLAEELGCDPSLPLQRLHQQILARRSRTERPSRRPRGQAPGIRTRPRTTLVTHVPTAAHWAGQRRPAWSADIATALDAEPSDRADIGVDGPRRCDRGAYLRWRRSVDRLPRPGGGSTRRHRR
ncbi:BTAD domain-containing putative transcriptional regulator [Streptomyces sp. NPDC102270]|uniref:AfsR/SARP family transcriptional regulator n=1 Tax=Streptomyces sp. NPDC102270 TaxID=3366150 RepID=UPI00380A0744